MKKYILKDQCIYKKYLKVSLLDTKSDINHRIKLINSFDYNRYKALTKTQIVESQEEYTYKQQFFPIKKKTLQKEDFFDLVDALEYMHSVGFVHADINRKNIIHTDDGFKIIDFEPSLYQMKQGIEQYMVTVPYVVKEELINKHLTTLTDKLGFLYFILRVQKNMSSYDVVKLSKSFEHEQYLKMKYSDIESMSYRELLENIL